LLRQSPEQRRVLHLVQSVAELHRLRPGLVSAYLHRPWRNRHKPDWPWRQVLEWAGCQSQ
jgi:hypothetical protein